MVDVPLTLWQHKETPLAGEGLFQFRGYAIEFAEESKADFEKNLKNIDKDIQSPPVPDNAYATNIDAVTAALSGSVSRNLNRVFSENPNGFNYAEMCDYLYEIEITEEEQGLLAASIIDNRDFQNREGDILTMVAEPAVVQIVHKISHAYWEALAAQTGTERSYYFEKFTHQFFLFTSVGVNMMLDYSTEIPTEKGDLGKGMIVTVGINTQTSPLELMAAAYAESIENYSKSGSEKDLARMDCVRMQTFYLHAVLNGNAPKFMQAYEDALNSGRFGVFDNESLVELISNGKPVVYEVSMKSFVDHVIRQYISKLSHADELDTKREINAAMKSHGIQNGLE